MPMKPALPVRKMRKALLSGSDATSRPRLSPTYRAVQMEHADRQAYSRAPKESEMRQQ